MVLYATYDVPNSLSCKAMILVPGAIKSNKVTPSFEMALLGVWPEICGAHRTAGKVKVSEETKRGMF